MAVSLGTRMNIMKKWILGSAEFKELISIRKELGEEIFQFSKRILTAKEKEFLYYSCKVKKLEFEKVILTQSPIDLAIWIGAVREMGEEFNINSELTVRDFFPRHIRQNIILRVDEDLILLESSTFSRIPPRSVCPRALEITYDSVKEFFKKYPEEASYINNRIQGYYNAALRLRDKILTLGEFLIGPNVTINLVKKYYPELL